jgi:hypothetical protein
MRKSFLIVAAVALAACGTRETESGGEVVDTLNSPNIDIDLGTTRDTVNLPTFGMETDTLIVKKPIITGRKPVEMKRPTVDVKKDSD